MIQNEVLLLQNHVLTIGLIIFTYVLYKWMSYDSRRKDLPPGPFGLPFVGFYPFIPYNWGPFCLNMRNKYGPIVHMNVAGIDTFFVTDMDIVKEAFTRDHFNDRVNRESFFGIWKPAGLTDWSGPRWKDQRRFSIKSFRDLGFGKKHGEQKVISELEHFIDYIEQFGQKGSRPIVIENPLGTCFSNLISLILGGERYHFETPTRGELNSYFLRSKAVSNERPILGLPTYYPTLAKIQAILFPNSAANQLKQIRLGTSDHMDRVIDKIMQDQPLDTDDGDESDSFVYSYLKHMNENPDSEFFTINNLKGCAVSFLLGGSVTTQDYMEWMIGMVALHPDIQQRMRDEIDETFGTSTPTTSDKLKCPFVECVIAEVHRFNTTVGINVTHGVSKDDYIGDYFFPKGSELIVNILGIHFREDYFPNPMVFNPDRFFKDGKYVKSEYMMPFGYGKRSCPGEVMAQMEIFLFTTGLIQRYNIILPEGVKVDTNDTDCNFFSRSPKTPISVIFQKRHQ